MSAVAPPVSHDVRTIRELIARHKRWDYIFGVIGIIALMIGVLTLHRAVRRHGDRRHSAPAAGVLHQLPVAPAGEGGDPVGLGRDRRW